ncbi:ABC_transp_aux domain-containing protein [Desulfovibrionales bacterium]
MHGLRRISQTILVGSLGLALLMGLNVLAVKWGWRWDTTMNKRHSLAPETVNALKNLNAAVTATAFFLPDDSREATENLFKLVAGKTTQFTFEFVDPDRSPLRAKQAQVTQRGSTVIASDKRQETIIFPDETKLINAITRVSSAKQSRILIISGHGELDPEASTTNACSQLKKVLSDQGDKIEKTALITMDAIPQDIDAVLLLGPKKDLLDRELQLLTDFLNGGGRLLIALSAEEHTNLDGWLNTHLSLARLPGLVVDPVSTLVSGDPLTPLVQRYNLSAITRDFGLMTLYPTCTALAPTDTNKSSIKGLFQSVGPLSPMGLSTEQSWLKTDLKALYDTGMAEFNPKDDIAGPLWLSAIYEAPIKDNMDLGKSTPQTRHKRLARTLIFGDQDFISDKYIHLVGNIDLARNGINWLLEREEFITVSKPKPVNAFLLLSPLERQLTKLITIVLIPGTTLAMAIIIAMKRRRIR